MGAECHPDSIEWCVDELRGQFVLSQVGHFIQRTANDVANAAPPDRVPVVKDAAGKLHTLAQQMSSHHQETTADLGFEDSWGRYQERAVARNFVDGLTFGLDEIDQHIMGVRPGEMAVFAGASGMGKSMLSVKSAFSEWRRGRLTVLITLENTIEMTIDRMACMAAGISSELWQRGTVSEGALQRFHTVKDRLLHTEHAPIIIQPENGDRDPVSLVRRAYSFGAESVIIDQVSHVENVPGSRVHKRNEQISEIIRELYSLINGREKIPMLLLSQIKREGIKEARKTGRYVMDDLAESSEVERSADFVFSVRRQERPEEGNEDLALWQTLKARRVQPKNWQVHWRLGVGDIRVSKEDNDG
jgi:replicative DNA helicase